MRVLLIILFFLSLTLKAQQFADKDYYLVDSLVLEDLSEFDRNLIDSCLKAYHLETTDTAKTTHIKAITNLSNNDAIFIKYSLYLVKVYETKLKKSNVNSYYKSKAKILLDISIYYLRHGELENSLIYIKESLQNFKKIADKEAIGKCYNITGIIYDSQGKVIKAIEAYKLSLKNYNEILNNEGAAKALTNIGIVYFYQEEFEKALRYYNESLIKYQTLNDSIGLARSFNNIGSVYNSIEDSQKALKYLDQALKIYNKTNLFSEKATCLLNIGVIHQKNKNLNKALDCFNSVLAIYINTGEKSNMATLLCNIGNLYTEKGNFTKAKEFLDKGFDLSEELNQPEKVLFASKAKKELALAQKNYQLAYQMHVLEIKMRDSINNLDIQKATIEQDAKYQYEKQKALDDLESQKKIELEAEKNKRQFVVTLLIASILLILIVFLIFIYRRLQITQKQKNIIEQQKQEVENKQEALEEAHKEINDSINYAELIQKSVLPSLKIEDLLNDAFIYFNPKDRVSGDFYWLEKKDKYSGYCVADCTGHGIPGAFISMIGTILLNEIHNSKQLNVPDRILSELSRLIELTLTDKMGNKMKDGMDMSFALLNNQHKILYFSGANNPIWVASSCPQKNIDKSLTLPTFEFQGKFMYEIKGDKQPIGFYGDHSKPFTLHRAELEKGDTFYLFSDGYVDQFGGERNKKFKVKAFRELLLSINKEPMNLQKNILAEKFESWKGMHEQIDDVTVIGVRV